MRIIQQLRALRWRLDQNEGSVESAAFGTQAAVRRLIGVIEQQQQQIEAQALQIAELSRRIDAQPKMLTDMIPEYEVQ